MILMMSLTAWMSVGVETRGMEEGGVGGADHLQRYFSLRAELKKWSHMDGTGAGLDRMK